MSKALVLALVLGVAACDSGVAAGLGAGPVSIETAQTGCTADCEHQAECGSTTLLELCIDRCVARAAEVLRADFFDDWTECRTALACGDTDLCDACAPTPAHTGFVARCRQLFSPCGPTPDEVDALCEKVQSVTNLQACMLSTDIIAELRACVAPPADCPDAYSCMRDVFDEHGVR